ncbi:MAG: GGDEF domain-containing protein [Woeseiaceae bacterium]
MNLGKLNEFINELTNDKLIKKKSLSLNVYYHNENEWYLGSDKVTSNQLRDTLFKTKKNGLNWRQKNSKNSYFYINSLILIVEIMFSAPTNKTTRDKLETRINECLKHSSNSFDANHDSLTGLLNKKGFNDALRDEIGEEYVSDLTEENSSDIVSSNSIISLLSFDIDHFKQVNDTHGHQFGDVVLRCFALKVEKKINNLNDGSFKSYTARPGGEEFSVVIVGNITKEKAFDMAESIRKDISDNPLPTDEEWDLIAADIFPSDKAKPHISERKITVSIGISSLVPSEANDFNRSIDKLISQADSALYRAKASGRNITINFDDILNKYGLVIEHHNDANIVAIDIGQQVEVKLGQEFHVFHPDFSGTSPFMHTDGRTNRCLGYYPKHSYGRIVVFDVQNEISFCQVLNKIPSIYFPTGSALESIPMGSIAHVIESESQNIGPSSIVDLLSIDQLKGEIGKDNHNDDSLSVIIFGISEFPELVKENGSAFINQSLANLYSTIKDKLSYSAKIAQMQLSEFAVVIDSENVKKLTLLVEEIIKKTTIKCTGKVEFYAGIYSKNISNIKIDGDKSELIKEYAIDYARYASSYAEDKKTKKVIVFTPKVASNIIYGHRNNKSFSKVMTDYSQLTLMGISYSRIHNHVALSEFENTDSNYDFAIAELLKAISLEENFSMFYANKALCEYKQGNSVHAYESFMEALSIEEGFELPKQYLPPFAASCYDAYIEDNNSVDINNMRKLYDSLFSSDEQHIVPKWVLREKLLSYYEKVKEI